MTASFRHLPIKYTSLNTKLFLIFFWIFSEVNDFIFAGNTVDQLDAEAFSLNANGRIIIEQNIFSRIDHLALTGTVVYRLC